MLAAISEGVEYDLLFLDIIILDEGREVLLSRNNLNAIHTAYAAHVSKQLTPGDY